MWAKRTYKSQKVGDETKEGMEEELETRVLEIPETNVKVPDKVADRNADDKLKPGVSVMNSVTQGRCPQLEKAKWRDEYCVDHCDHVTLPGEL